VPGLKAKMMSSSVTTSDRRRFAPRRTLSWLAATSLGLVLALPATGTPATAIPAPVGTATQTAAASSASPVGAVTPGAAPAWSRDSDDDSRLELSGHSKWTRPLLGVVIGLDPGHNGGNVEDMARISERISDGRGGATACDTPGRSTHNGYREHEFTFEVAQLLTEQLEFLGATVVSTRDDDVGVGPCGDLRGRFAEDHDVDAMLSLHAISSREPEDTGFMVIVADPPVAASQEEPSRELAQSVADAMEVAGFEPSPEADDVVAGRADLAALNFARRPAVRVELGQMYHRAEAELMASEEGRIAYAEALAEGVLNWATAQ